MLSEKKIGAALGRVNPVPDPTRIVSDAESEALFAAISQRRQTMVITDHGHARQDERNISRSRPWYRRSAALATALVIALIAVPAVGLLRDWDTPPPLDRDFPPGISQIVLYGPDEGVGEYCATSMDFDASGGPVLGGICGVLVLDGGQWSRVAHAEGGTGGLMDIAVAGDGTLWVADIDRDLQSVADDSATGHGFSAMVVEIATDGTVWALRLSIPEPSDQVVLFHGPELLSYDGSAWFAPDIGPVSDIVAGLDGSLWTLARTPIDDDPSTQTPLRGRWMLGRFLDGTFTTEPMPFDALESSLENLTVAPDGALWMIHGTNRVVMREGISDTETEIVRFDGSEWTSLVVPFSHVNDVAVHPNGTVWATSSLYGVFAYDGDQWRRYGTAEGLPSEGAYFVEIGPDGSVFVGTTLGLVRLTLDTG